MVVTAGHCLVVGRGQDASRHAAAYRTLPTTKNDPAPNLSYAAVEKTYPVQPSHPHLDTDPSLWQLIEWLLDYFHRSWGTKRLQAATQTVHLQDLTFHWAGKFSGSTVQWLDLNVNFVTEKLDGNEQVTYNLSIFISSDIKWLLSPPRARTASIWGSQVYTFSWHLNACVFVKGMNGSWLAYSPVIFRNPD